MAYSGKYKVKNPTKYRGDHTNIVYRSQWEKYVFMWCDNNEDISQWSSEEIIIPYFYEVDKKYHRYFPDVFIKFKNGRTILVEIKPEKETKPPEFKGRKTKQYLSEGLTYVKNMNKWSAAQNFVADRGWGFEIWTENHLERYGIKPKSTKALKPLKPYTKKAKKTI